MLRDLTNPKKIDKQAVLAAIAALRTRAWDINPYTIADEMKTSRTNIYRNSEVMELINEARQQAGLPMIHADDGQEPHGDSSESSNVGDLEERIQRLEAENAELQELQKDNWQRGYRAGWDEASIYLANSAPFPTEPFTESSTQDSYETSDVTNEAPSDETYSNTEFQPSAIEEGPSYQASEFQEFPPEFSQEFAYTPEEQSCPEEAQPEEQDTEEDVDTTTISTEDLRNILKQHREKSEGDPTQGKAKGLAASKFARPANEPPQRGFILRTVPPDIRKACLVLGIRPEELNRQAIMESWKREITRPGTHPDQGGDSEIAVYLNTAKDVLLRWWETQEPKLGKQFGSQAKQQAGADEPDETEPSI